MNLIITQYFFNRETGRDSLPLLNMQTTLYEGHSFKCKILLFIKNWDNGAAKTKQSKTKKANKQTLRDGATLAIL